MTDAMKAMIAKFIAAGVDLPAGTDEMIDETVTLHVKGTVKRGQDGEYTPTISIPVKATLAILLERMGFQRDYAAELLVECMTQALNEETQAAPIIAERLKDIDAAEERVRAVLEALPKATRRGATTMRGTVTVVEELVVA